ncbi:hypothetical protein [Baekduia sp.]|jgi:hypothetical protein|uniref:hypothetical protein n=1 Tax=Baekduia sp. TaxID=2600305 RepID=UPI002E04A3DB|nr:hypothetical protein [Baekduia sp.]
MPFRRLVVLLAVVAAATLAGCSGPAPVDLFLVQRTGSIAGARLTLRISDDGGAYCNGGKRREITSAQLITAREIRRELDGDKNDDENKIGLAAKHINLPPGDITTLSYRVRSEMGTVVFSDTSAHQPQTFYRLAQLTRDVARGACGLPR